MTTSEEDWTLKGVSDIAQEYAEKSAAAAGISVSTWLKSIIYAEAKQNLEAADPSNRADDSEGSTIERAVQAVKHIDYEPEGPATDADLINDLNTLKIMQRDLEEKLLDPQNVQGKNHPMILQEIERIKSRIKLLQTS
tara:strand:+ start:1904 stop:2317 length:414 start_codon:yes stop_codon:yes gene_type:complete